MRHQVILLTLITSFQKVFASSRISAGLFRHSILIQRSVSTSISYPVHRHSPSYAIKNTMSDTEDTPKKKKARSSSSSSSSTSSSSSSSSSSSALPFASTLCHPSRARPLNNCKLPDSGDCVVAWMFRDQRAEDNYALLYAQELAASKGIPLKVVFNIFPGFLGATLRQYDFMLKGLDEVQTTLRAKEIPMYLLIGDPITNLTNFARDHKAMAVICDFFPLRIHLTWSSSIAKELEESLKIPMVQVDTHNVVPCWVASNKLEYGARTIRGKIQALLPQYLKDIPPLTNNPPGSLASCPNVIDFNAVLASLEINRKVAPVTWLKPGARGANETLDSFIEKRLVHYEGKRNDPNVHASSDLSPYFHYGQLSPQRAVLKVKAAKKYLGGTDSFVEEAVVRRELADNFCFYNPQYDSLTSLYAWAKETLQTHSSDPRSVVYTQDQLEQAQTHDDLWNAAQLQMTTLGKMHGFLRMYWAKKILEWTSSPEEALRISIYLNDKYELDGRDPNGYVGCMWSIGGIHDQGWGERAVFGKIRYMNYAGCKKKFSIPDFVKKFPPAAANAAVATKAHPKAMK